MDTQRTNVFEAPAFAISDERRCVLSSGILASEQLGGSFSEWQSVVSPMGRAYATQHLITPSQGAVSR